jgi:hypothetical protein
MRFTSSSHDSSLVASAILCVYVWVVAWFNTAVSEWCRRFDYCSTLSLWRENFQLRKNQENAHDTTQIFFPSKREIFSVYKKCKLAEGTSTVKMANFGSF